MKKGLTLTELLVTIIISGILFMTIGIMFYNTLSLKKKGETKIDLQEKMRYAELHMKTDLRKATTFYIENPQTLRFFVKENNLTKKITVENQQLVLKVNDITRLILLERINYLRLQQIGASADTLKVDLSGFAQGFNNEIFNSSTTFFVKIRNKFFYSYSYSL